MAGALFAAVRMAGPSLAAARVAGVSLAAARHARAPPTLARACPHNPLIPFLHPLSSWWHDCCCGLTCKGPWGGPCVWWNPNAVVDRWCATAGSVVVVGRGEVGARRVACSLASPAAHTPPSLPHPAHHSRCQF